MLNERALKAAQIIIAMEYRRDPLFMRFGKDWTPLGPQLAVAMSMVDILAAYIAIVIPNGLNRDRALLLLSDTSSNIVHAYATRGFNDKSNRTDVPGMEGSNAGQSVGAKVIPFPGVSKRLPSSISALLSENLDGTPTRN